MRPALCADLHGRPVDQALNRSQAWLLFKRQPGWSRESGASLPLSPCRLSPEPKQSHMWEALKKGTRECGTKAFREVRRQAGQGDGTKQKQSRRGDKSIKQGLDSMRPRHQGVTRKKGREWPKWGVGEE